MPTTATSAPGSLVLPSETELKVPPSRTSPSSRADLAREWTRLSPSPHPLFSLQPTAHWLPPALQAQRPRKCSTSRRFSIPSAFSPWERSTLRRCLSAAPSQPLLWDPLSLPLGAGGPPGPSPCLLSTSNRPRGVRPAPPSLQHAVPSGAPVRGGPPPAPRMGHRPPPRSRCSVSHRPSPPPATAPCLIASRLCRCSTDATGTPVFLTAHPIHVTPRTQTRAPAPCRLPGSPIRCPVATLPPHTSPFLPPLAWLCFRPQGPSLQETFLGVPPACVSRCHRRELRVGSHTAPYLLSPRPAESGVCSSLPLKP